ncbi:OprO/OprP family phosphate-selective porin [Actomonas aquatica]|uniref:Porin n=1 Tax=Actomonas aquatica TaxID=2866162 RepID=A0ABZ1CAE5_9BACT|nr:porin [Opitutus sp. WL0086]WRQ87564.1 porin [Opitutus sp. WL0086]
MWNSTSSRAATMAVALLLSASTPWTAAAATDDGEIAALREQIRQLDAKLRALEAQPTPAPVPVATSATATATVDRRGLVVTSADRSYALRIRPRIQVDAHWFPDAADGATDLTLRRVRPVVEGQAGPLKWRFMPELAGTVRILDAWGDVQVTPHSFVRIGKIKTAVGYERLQSFSKTLFLERGLPSTLTATRDLGLQWHATSGGVLDWSLGVTSGALDDTDLSANANLSSGDFDLEARLALQPFRPSKDHPLAGLTLGLAAQTGTEQVTIADADRDRRIRYRTSGRNTFFRYADGVTIDGDRTRLNAFLSYYAGPFGFLTEWVRSSYDVSRLGPAQTIDTDAWTAQFGWVVTGESASYGGFRPARPFDPAQGQWGGLELGLRFHTLRGDEAAFAGDATERFARTGSVQNATAWGAAANWVLTDNLLIGLNWETTSFSGAGTARADEQVILSRLQIDF